MSHSFHLSPRVLFSTFALTLSCVAIHPVHAQQPSIDHSARHERAIEQSQANLRPADPGASNRLVALADALLRAGQVNDSIPHYERAIEQSPDMQPYLWQYGIALFFAGRFEDGRELFEAHRRVNPNDVENAAWHFLCEAKANGIDSARKLLLPAPGDRRVPMSEILDRLPGGDAAAIESAVNAIDQPGSKQSARFYADLYLGMIADAEGKPAAAQRFMQQAAASPLSHYMADVARVYAKHLQDSTEPDKR
ncbi:tetratricopeptide repeat protein [Rhodopirellula sp. P2]|uniref:tetratricopeptide repeat protein n=1 Tax=Rhodopirellula sp. P2 TaxID=2127060 RepID=UPI002367FE8B|nr:tetratricopeptide repeat protein [Rhodopirellula sp. P2]WDQ16673.1 tetratricopeptide repeat protein [Rhodopirellula sp. P2]